MVDEIKVRNEVKSLIAGIIDVEEDKLDENASFIDDLGLDSLRALEILAALEKQYQIEIPEEVLTQLTTVNKTANVALNILK
ncbi:MAG TPA: acyl carrier protein, partial [Clostridia bacterium]